MACSSCSANVERRLNSLKGVQSASVSLAGRTALVDYDEHEISLSDMKREINAIGYDLVIESGRSAEAIQRREYAVLRRRTLLSWVPSVLGMAVSMKWINLGNDSFTIRHRSGNCAMAQPIWTH